MWRVQRSSCCTGFHGFVELWPLMARSRALPTHAAAIFCAAVAVVIYWNTLQCGICYDDEPAIKKNKDLRPDVTSWFDLFKHDFWGADITSSSSHKSYRPLTVATFRLNYMLHELEPLGYHLVNVLLHSAVVYLYVLLCGAVFSQVWPALIAGLLFAVHPIHTEAVAGLVGRTELLSGIFFCLAFLTYRQASLHYKKSGNSWLAVTVLFVLCSFLSKEQGITVVAVCVVYDAFCIQKLDLFSGLRLLRSPSAIPRGLLYRSLVLAVSTLSFLLFRVRLMKGGPDIFTVNINPPLALDTPYRQLSWSYLIFVNSWLLLNPYSLCADWRFGAVPLIKSLIDPHNLPTLVTFSVIGVLGWRAVTGKGKIDKLLVVALALLVLPFVPASNLFFPVGFVVAERVLYLPSMGQCFLVALGGFTILRDRRGIKFILTTIFLLLATLHGLKTFQRNFDWRTNFHVYSSGMKVNPTNGVLLTNLGIEYANMQNFSYAETLYRRAIEVSPDHSKGYGNLGGLLEALGQDEEAEESLMKAVSFGTSDDTLAKLLDTYEFLIKTVLMKNESKLSRALAVLDDALQQYPGIVTLHSLRANVLTRLGRLAEAKAALETASNAPRVMPIVHFNLGLLYVEQGDVKSADQSFRNAIARKPDYYEAVMELGRLRYWNGIGDQLQAENKLREAYSQLPKSFLAPFYLGEVFVHQKNYREGKKLILKGNSRSKGTYRHILYRLGELHLELKEFPSAVHVLEQVAKLDPKYRNVQALLKRARKHMHSI